MADILQGTTSELFPSPLKRDIHSRKTLLSLLCVGAALRMGSFFLSENAGGDALARVGLTAQWLQNPTANLHFSVWLPIHFWMIAATSFLVRDVEMAGRLLSLVLGIASLMVFWTLCEELDGFESASYSTILFAFYSLHIAYSATSSCDGPYLFFLLAGLAFFFRWRNRDDLPLLPFAALSLTLSSGIRYEAWIVILALDVILLWRKDWAAFALFAPLSGIWPIFWMTYEWITRGNPLYAPVLNHYFVAQDLGAARTSLLYRLLLPPGVILLTLTPLVLIGILFSIRYIVSHDGPLREFAFVVCLFALAQVYQIISGGVMSFARYTLTLGTMVAILSGIGLRQLLPPPKVVAALMILNVVALAILGSVNNPFLSKVRSVSPILRFVPYLHDAGEFLKWHLGKSDAVVIDNLNHEANQLAFLGGMPLLENERTFQVSDSIDPAERAKNFSQLLPYLHNKRPKYLVYSNRGELRAFMSFLRMALLYGSNRCIFAACFKILNTESTRFNTNPPPRKCDRADT